MYMNLTRARGRGEEEMAVIITFCLIKHFEVGILLRQILRSKFHIYTIFFNRTTNLNWLWLVC
jgi:hypothetical protein